MSVESVLQRVALLEQALSNPSALMLAARTGGTAAPSAPVESVGEGGGAGGSSFAAALQSASAAYGQTPGTGALEAQAAPGVGAANGLGISPLSPTSTTPGSSGGTGSRIVQIAESQVGQAEQPPGSNEGPAIATYRGATAGATPGAPWCAYFASWVARQAGLPLGAQGEGLGSVDQISSWAQSTGRSIQNGPGVTPQPGDLILFGSEHVGIVKGVRPDGQIETIEGNYENKVAQNVRSPTEATSYVNMS